ncbi:MAG: hypothetical protein DMG38_24655 [Acidobacteria bacterium]|nr:MAG: hypothetical protein DMG38_24655 [Acidobacteriota bacterium]
MCQSPVRFTTILGLAIAMGVFASQLEAQQHCGKERWSVKTGTDSDAGTVNLSSPQSTTIGQLISLTPPNPIPMANRFAPTETTVFVVNATLTDYKLEGGAKGDSDYHLVLKDDQGHTMVAEIPFPGCVGAGSPFAAQIANARAEFDGQFTATTSFQTANVPVQVTGVGFFDFPHGQHGAAPNIIELHPVLDIAFTSSGTSPDFTLSLAPSTVTLIQGGSSSVTISTTMTGGATGSPTLTVSGTPPGISAQITTTGPGKATLALTASQVAATGSFPLTVTGTAGGKSHSQTAQLSVSPFWSVPSQWEYQVITANSENDVITQANTLGAEEWELVSVVKVPGTTNSWRAFFKRPKNNF